MVYPHMRMSGNNGIYMPKIHFWLPKPGITPVAVVRAVAQFLVLIASQS